MSDISNKLARSLFDGQSHCLLDNRSSDGTVYLYCWRIVHMAIGLAVLGAMVVLVMYLILSRFQYTVRESTTTV